MSHTIILDSAQLVEVARRHGIVYLAMFGSFAREEAAEDSDVDLIAHFLDPQEVGFLQLMRIQEEMAEVIGRPVQLFTEEEIHPYIRKNVDKDRVVLLNLEKAQHIQKKEADVTS